MLYMVLPEGLRKIRACITRTQLHIRLFLYNPSTRGPIPGSQQSSPPSVSEDADKKDASAHLQVKSLSPGSSPSTAGGVMVSGSCIECTYKGCVLVLMDSNSCYRVRVRLD